jgi:hypothetical protein
MNMNTCVAARLKSAMSVVNQLLLEVFFVNSEFELHLEYACPGEKVNLSKKQNLDSYIKELERNINLNTKNDKVKKENKSSSNISNIKPSKSTKNKKNETI